MSSIVKPDSEIKTVLCFDPFQKHKVPFRANKSKFRVITSALAENDPSNLIVGKYICNSCRHSATLLKKSCKLSLVSVSTSEKPTSSNVITEEKKSKRNNVCANPFLLHKERRKNTKKSWYYVSAKLSLKCAHHGVNLAEGLQLCYDCYIKCLSTIENEQLKSTDCYCRDPLNRHAKPRKKNILFGFKKPSTKILSICSDLGHEVKSDDYLCAHCRNYIKKISKSCVPCSDSKKDPANEETVENVCNVADALEVLYSESETSFITESDIFQGSLSSSESEYYDSDVEVDHINHVLKDLKLNNITKSIRHTDENLKKLHASICENVKASLLKLAKRNVDFEKPIFMSNDKCKCKECKTCISALAARIKEASNKTEKYQMLTCTPSNLTMKEIEIGYKISQKMAEKSYTLKKTNGPFSAPPRQVGKKLSSKLVDDAKAFYLQPENSSTCPDQRKTIILRYLENGKMQKKPVAKQEMRVTLKELHKEFRIQFPNYVISVSKFSLLKPKECQWGKGIGFQNTCKCINHENFKLLLEPLKLGTKTEELLRPFFCALDEKCLLGLCVKCPNIDIIKSLVSKIKEETIVYMEWIKGNSRAMELLKKSVSKQEYINLIQECLQSFGPHYYVHIQQRDFIKNLQSSFLVNSSTHAVLLVDFGENYSFVVANEVQSFHWSNKQCTILPCVLYYYCPKAKAVQTLVYVVLSDTATHDANSFHVFRSKVIQKVKIKFPEINFVTYVSDNCGGQFKNKKNFCNLRYHYKDFGMNSKWVFSAAGHGKGLSDAYSAITKRSTRLESLRRGSLDPILDVQEMFKYLNETKTTDTLKFLLVTENEITDHLSLYNIEKRYEGLKTVKGTRLFHDVEVGVGHTLFFKKVSSSLQIFEFNIFEDDSETQCCTQPEISIGTYVAFIYGNKMLTGVVETALQDEGEYEIRMMKKLDKGQGYKWYDPVKVDCVSFIDVIGMLNIPTTPNGRVYTFDNILHEKMKALAEGKLNKKKLRI